MTKIIRREKPKADECKNLVTGLIVNTEFCKEIAPTLDPSLLESIWAKRVAAWIKSYYEKYGKAPRRHIKRIYEQEIEKLDDTEADLIGEYLAHLSQRFGEKYDKLEDFEARPEIDRASEYLEERHIARFIKDVKRAPDSNQAKAIIKDFKPLAIGSGTDDLYSQATSAMYDAVNGLTKLVSPPKLIVEPFLRETSIGLVWAPTGVGKSWLCLCLAHALELEDPPDFGPWKFKQNCSTLYVDGEMHAVDVPTRYEKLILGRAEKPRCSNHRLTVLSSHLLVDESSEIINLTLPKWRDTIYRILQTHPKFKLLVLDNKRSLCPGLDENAVAPWDPINQWLLSLRFLGVAVILIHHAGKDKSRGPRGAVGILDNLDYAIFMNGDPNEAGVDATVSFWKPVRFAEREKQQPFQFRIERSDQRDFWCPKRNRWRPSLEEYLKFMTKHNKKLMEKEFGTSKLTQEISEQLTEEYAYIFDEEADIGVVWEIDEAIKTKEDKPKDKMLDYLILKGRSEKTILEQLGTKDRTRIRRAKENLRERRLIILPKGKKRSILTTAGREWLDDFEEQLEGLMSPENESDGGDS